MSLRKEYEQELAKRLGHCLSGCNNKHLAEITSAIPESVRRWRKTGAAPAYFLARIVEEFGFSPSWVLVGQGPLHTDHPAIRPLDQSTTDELLLELGKRVVWTSPPKLRDQDHASDPTQKASPDL